MIAKTVLKFDIIQVLIKILKNVKHIEELALKVEKGNCKSKKVNWQRLSTCFLETLPASFDLPLKWQWDKGTIPLET